MSANSYKLDFRSHQEVVNCKRDGRMITLDINGAPIIVVDMITGRAALHNPKIINTLQKKNCFNRFFTLVEATRYVAENTDDGLVVKDAKTNIVIGQAKDKLVITLPVKSIMIILASFNKYGECTSTTVSQWLGDFKQAQLKLIDKTHTPQPSSQPEVMPF